jgi:hypothetical protein
VKPAAWIGVAVAILAGTTLAIRSPPTERPTLLLLTSLPILFDEEFTLEQSPSPVLRKLEESYRVAPIAVADRSSLASGRLLLAAHPRAQPAEVLVALDQWVRGGGHVLLLADPKLDWHSDKPLGDMTRPPPDFADTGLLARWGLSMTVVAGRTMGALRPLVGSACKVEADALTAHCAIGKGKVTVIADADFLEAGDDQGLDRLGEELKRLTPAP